MYKDVCKRISAFMPDSMPDCDDSGMADDCLGRTGNGKHLSERRRGTGGSARARPRL